MKESNLLRAGAGRANIHFPQEMFPTDGFCKVHDDPYIRVLILESGIRFAIVEAELVVVAKPFVIEIKKTVSELTGVPGENIWVHSTHVITTPHAPGPKGPPSKRPPMSEEDKRKRVMFTDALMEAVRQAAKAAAGTFQPTLLSVGTGQCDVNCSCRQQDVERGLRAPSDGLGTTNKTMTILKFQALTGEPIGFLLFYDVKPCVIDNSEMDKGTRQVSSDVPGKACAVVEETFGVTALYCMGATGDQHPREQTYYETADQNGNLTTVDLGVAHGLELVERYGTIMGEDAIAIINAMTDAQPVDAIVLTGDQFQWPSKPDPNKPGPQEPEMSTIPVQAARIGDIALVGTSPEVNCATELQLQQVSPFGRTLLITMVNGPMKYMPDKTAFEQNTREAQRSFAQEGAAERFVEVAAEMLRRLK